MQNKLRVFVGLGSLVTITHTERAPIIWKTMSGAARQRPQSLLARLLASLVTGNGREPFPLKPSFPYHDKQSDDLGGFQKFTW